ncbi:lanthionine synthetase LanC family protein [Nocardia goodfellowii]
MYWHQPVPSARPPVLGPHLYAGTAGISLFFAAMAKVFDADEFREISERAIAPVRADIRQICADPVRMQRLQQPLGGLAGLGSVIYTLVRIGDLLNDESFADDAQIAARLLSADRIAAAKHDVMIGSAGAIMALLALAERRPKRIAGGERPLELAVRCARHLSRSDEWISAEGPAAAGFCHGRAGIGAAFARLYERTNRPELWQMVPRLFADVASSGPSGPRQAPTLDDRFLNSWCKGAPGIALGHIALSRVTSRRQPGDTVHMLETTGAPGLSETDDLCCGNSGRIDVLVYAASALREPGYLDAAAAIATRVMQRAREQGRYSLKLANGTDVDPRLFPGVAGIGYSLLRLSAPDSLPCVLAMA